MDALSQAISKIGVVPVIKLNHPERDAAALGKALCAGGVPVAEVTFRASGADKAIRLMKEACPDMIVGAGTVTTTEQIDAALAAGAQFIVSPGFDADLVAYAQKKASPFIRAARRPRTTNSAGSPEILPRRAVRRTGENQGHERPVPAVQGYAYGRRIPEEPERVFVLPGHRRLRRVVHGDGGLNRQSEVGRNHGTLQEVRGNREGGSRKWLRL